jgi:hypothetical protein
MARVLFVLGLCSFWACKTEDSAASHGKPTADTVKLAGVRPDRFECESIAPATELARVLGASAHKLDNPGSVPDGVAKPCTYTLATQPPESWVFDFDCRDGYKKTADALFAQYQQTSADLVNQYNTISDAGVIKPDDAGIAVRRAPETAAQVSVGAKALDHHGQGLIFIDDDAPCYVRVVGPDAARRLELSRLIAKQLTFANAPMTPRPFP